MEFISLLRFLVAEQWRLNIFGRTLQHRVIEKKYQFEKMYQIHTKYQIEAKHLDSKNKLYGPRASLSRSKITLVGTTHAVYSESNEDESWKLI